MNFKKTLKRILIYFIILLVLVFAGSLLYMQHPRFGKAASGKRLERMQQSPHYKNGAFENLEHTPNFKEGYTMVSAMKTFFFEKSKNLKPAHSLPSIKTDLKSIPINKDVLVWFGHSSYYFQASGVRFLVDPVFSNNASPVYGTTNAFNGTNMYTASDMPSIDYLIITHDHFDHLDYATIKQLMPKVKHVLTGLGVGAHLEYWGFKPDQIIENDWQDSIVLQNNLKLYTVPARHFSGRTFKRNTTLWVSFVLETPTQKIFIGGDSGYGKHFATIGDTYGPFDLAIIENGQYHDAWHYIHCLPEETLQAAKDLKARSLMPVHNSKFPLSIHAWNEPMEDITKLNEKFQLHLVRPMIGEQVSLHDSTTTWKAWWKEEK